MLAAVPVPFLAAAAAIALAAASTAPPAPPRATAGDDGAVSRARGSAGRAARTTPPSDGTTAWAPSPGDPEWVNVRDRGAVGDGIADDTAAFRSAAATGKKLFVPKPPVAYKLTGFVQVRNSVYGDGSMPVLRMHGADGDPDQGHARNILLISGYAGPGLVVSGLRLDGGWDGAGSAGEWSHAIRILSSRNVTIQNCILERPYGDCIFIGHYAGSSPSAAPDNVVVQDNVLRGPRRCCVAVISGTRITIRRNQIHKASDYVAAIDLEPDPLGYQHVDGVTIADNSFHVAPIRFGGGAISLNDPRGNERAPRSGNVSITGNHGTWTPAAGYLRLAGSDGLVGIVPHLPWSNVTASDNRRRR